MTISDIITNNYTMLKKRVKKYNSNIELLEGDDVLGDIALMALRKFKDKDITEEEGLRYMLRNLYFESVFRPKRQSSLFVPLNNYDVEDDTDYFDI